VADNHQLVTIAIDAMGGDHGPSVTLHGVKLSLERYPELSVVLVGREDALSPFILKYKLDKFSGRVRVHQASEVVEMTDSPALALKNKKDSSMRVALDLLKEGVVNGCVSAGNTGALMATSRFVLKMLPRIDRPAIMYSLPTFDPITKIPGRVHMLDLGANVACTEEHLFQFAVMGSVFSSQVDGLASPTIGLLNIGEEDMKGLEVIKLAAQKISSCSSLNYIGNVEGTDILKGKANVIVCDGFIGNIALKTIEGTVRYVASQMKMAFNRNWLTRLCGLLAWPLFREMRKNLDLRKYNGASLLGLKGIVIKSHGSADPESFSTAIGVAIHEVKKDIPNKIHALIDEILGREDVR
jgi:glycerol-3-phosphate acyltransferase PlsX